MNVLESFDLQLFALSDVEYLLDVTGAHTAKIYTISEENGKATALTGNNEVDDLTDDQKIALVTVVNAIFVFETELDASNVASAGGEITGFDGNGVVTFADSVLTFGAAGTDVLTGTAVMNSAPVSEGTVLTDGKQTVTFSGTEKTDGGAVAFTSSGLETFAFAEDTLTPLTGETALKTTNEDFANSSFTLAKDGVLTIFDGYSVKAETNNTEISNMNLGTISITENGAAVNIPTSQNVTVNDLAIATKDTAATSMALT